MKYENLVSERRGHQLAGTDQNRVRLSFVPRNASLCCKRVCVREREREREREGRERFINRQMTSTEMMPYLALSNTVTIESANRE